MRCSSRKKEWRRDGFLPTLRRKNKIMKNCSGIIYVVLLVTLSMALAVTYIPGIMFLGSWVTPPVALFIGLLFAIVFGQPFPDFNKKISKKLLQYSVVGLGFGMNIEASLASGKDGMLFTIISVFGTLLIGWLIGRKLLNVDRNCYLWWQCHCCYRTCDKGKGQRDVCRPRNCIRS